MANIFNQKNPFNDEVIIESNNCERFDKQYPDINKYLNEFQINLNLSIINGNDSKRLKDDLIRSARTELSKIKKNNNPSITVFKKKNLKSFSFDNIYEHNLSRPDLDLNDSTKSKVSCIRCRKFKKKCTRRLPECSNCLSSDELCIYLPRKIKKSTKSYNRDKTESNRIQVESLLPISKSTPIRLPSISDIMIDKNCLNNFKRLSLPNISNPSKTDDSSPSYSVPFSSSNLRYSPNNYSYNERFRKKHSNDFNKILN